MCLLTTDDGIIWKLSCLKVSDFGRVWFRRAGLFCFFTTTPSSNASAPSSSPSSQRPDQTLRDRRSRRSIQATPRGARDPFLNPRFARIKKQKIQRAKGKRTKEKA